MASAKLLLIVAIGATFSIIAATDDAKDDYDPLDDFDDYDLDELATFEPYLTSVSSKRKELYHYKYSNHNYYDSEEKGLLLNPGTEQEEFVVIGRYTQYYGIKKENHAHIRISVYYIADKNGYRPMFTEEQWLPAIQEHGINAQALKNSVG